MQTFFHVWKEGIEQDSTAWTAEMGIFRENFMDSSLQRALVWLNLYDFSNENNLGFHMRYHFFEILMITLVFSGPKQSFYTSLHTTVL